MFIYESNPLCEIEEWGRERKRAVRRVCSREEVQPSFSRHLISLFKVTCESGIDNSVEFDTIGVFLLLNFVFFFFVPL